MFSIDVMRHCQCNQPALQLLQASRQQDATSALLPCLQTWQLNCRNFLHITLDEFVSTRSQQAKKLLNTMIYKEVTLQNVDLAR